MVKRAIVAAFVLAACGDDDGGGPDPTAARADLAAAIATEALLPTFRAFAASAAELEVKAEAHASAPTPATRDAARSAFLEAMLDWQEAELMQVGPVGPATETRGGRDLRDEIYAWPLAAACRVESLLIASDFDPATIASQPVNVRGLSVIEQLLFTADDAPVCATDAAVVSAWSTLGDAEIARRKAQYALAAARIVRERADEVLRTFAPSGDDFAGELGRGGRGSELFASGQASLNAISDALFYLDTETKDMKLAEPAGISVRCTTDVCPERAESLYARRSREYILANLRGFLRVYRGGDAAGARGFDDLLVERGAAELATAIETETNAAIAATEAIPGSLEEALTTDRASVVAAYDAVKGMLDDVKTQMLSVLDLELPERAEGDND